MIDLNEQLEVFIITNGRSTFPYVHDSIKEQKNVKFQTTIHRDMTWIEANRRILEVCKSPFFVRVDDDMILNKYAIHFMWHAIQGQSSRIVLRGFRLWEPYSEKVIKGVKVYQLQKAQELGFQVSHIGKIDKIFQAKARKKRYKVKYGEDVVGIHCCSNFDEHLRYALMRGEDKGSRFGVEKAWMRKVIKNCPYSLHHQARLAGKFLRRWNRKHHTNFAKFMRRVS